VISSCCNLSSVSKNALHIWGILESAKDRQFTPGVGLGWFKRTVHSKITIPSAFVQFRKSSNMHDFLSLGWAIPLNDSVTVFRFYSLLPFRYFLLLFLEFINPVALRGSSLPNPSGVACTVKHSSLPNPSGVACTVKQLEFNCG